MQRRRLLWLGGSALAIASCGAWKSSSNLLISAAASLQGVAEDLRSDFDEQRFGQDRNVALSFNFGASGALAQQIVTGAPVDALLAAAPEPMDDLEERGLLLPDSRRVLASNRIVLIVPNGRPLVKGFNDLSKGTTQTVAMALPDSAPVGRYSDEVLRSLGLRSPIADKLIFGRDARQVLAYVETQNADAGLVYATDARSSDRVHVVAMAPLDSHSQISYPAAVLRQSARADLAREFINFAASPAGRPSFERWGFLAPPEPRS